MGNDHRNSHYIYFNIERTFLMKDPLPIIAALIVVLLAFLIHKQDYIESFMHAVGCLFIAVFIVLVYKFDDSKPKE